MPDEQKRLETYVDLAKEYDDIVTLAAAHIQDAKNGEIDKFDFNCLHLSKSTNSVTSICH